MPLTKRLSYLVPLVGLMSSLLACGGSGGAPPAATSFAISGTVSGASSVTVTLSGTATATATTDPSGNYSFAALSNGSYSVTPSRAGYTFAPLSIAMNVKGADMGSNAFAATAAASATYSLSGTVSGAVARDVMVTLNGAATGSVAYGYDALYACPPAPARSNCSRSEASP